MNAHPEDSAVIDRQKPAASPPALEQRRDSPSARPENSGGGIPTGRTDLGYAASHPGSVVEEVDRALLVGERKHVTVLCADLKESLERLAEEDAEKALETFEATLTLMKRTVHLVETSLLEGVPGDYRLVRPMQEQPIPPSVHALLAARIDRLPGRSKRLLHAASVVGKDVPRAILERIERAHAFLEKEGITLALQRLLQGDKTRVIAQQTAQECVSRFRRQGIKTYMRVIGPAPPGVNILRTGGQNEQDRRGCQTADQGIQERLRLARWAS